MLRRQIPVAGRSAARKYEALTVEWRRRNRGQFAKLAGAFAVVAVLINAYAVLFGGDLNWGAGCVVGFAAGLFWHEWKNPPGWIEQWQQGAWGEEATAEALRPLEADGWVLLHDLAGARDTNLDHVAIGPGGVFLLDSKALDGTVTVEATTATVTRPGSELRYGHDFGPRMRSQAYEAHQRLRAATGYRQWVTPVVVLWSDAFPQRAVGDHKGVLVAGSALAEWLRAQGHVLPPERVRQFAGVLSSTAAAPAD